MNTAKNKLIYTLGFLGLIPFIVSSLAELMQVESLFGIQPLKLLITYGAIILTFLGGVLWGRALHRAESEPTNALLVLSNAFAILAWLTLLLDLSLIHISEPTRPY